MLGAAPAEHDRDPHLAAGPSRSSPPDPSRSAGVTTSQACGTTRLHRRRSGRALPPAFPLGLRLAGALSTSTPPAARSSACSSSSPPFEGQLDTALWLGLATLFIDGTDGMLARRFAGQGDDPLVRRRPAGQHRRLPDLRLRPRRPALDDRPPAGRRAGLGARRAAAARVQLPVLPGGREDRRPLLPRVPELLEHRRLLRDRAGPRHPGDGRDPGDLRDRWCSCRCATSTRRGLDGFWG